MTADIEVQVLHPNTPGVVVESCDLHYFRMVCDVGEDGDVLVLGHHDDNRRTAAAIIRHERKKGLWAEDIGQLGDILNHIERLWCQLVTECCGNPVQDSAAPEGPCPSCDVVTDWDDDGEVSGTHLEAPRREWAWCCDWSASEGAPGAFPITLLRR